MPSRDIVQKFARLLFGRGDIHVDIQPLGGGLESEGVSLVRAQPGDGAAAMSFVVKPMSGAAVREFRVHAAVERSMCGAAPRILGSIGSSEQDRVYVFLEWIPAIQEWPWSQREHVVKVLQQLARLHECDVTKLAPYVSDWDYDADLTRSAITTVELYRRLFINEFRIGTRPMVRPLERVASAIVAMRKQAIQDTGAALLHGDVHPGNAVLRERKGSTDAVLLDWGRARLGSPLEDVMSWLHSLGFWEPNARRMHDSLLAEYRRACGSPDGLPDNYRSVSWLAGACNAMAGALRYHLAVSADPERAPEDRWNSARAAADWLRIVRRADAVWRS